MATWEDIQKLQAELQRIQKSKTAQKLSERNCVEIVNHLMQTGAIDVLFTLDGKEYITPQQLDREIKEELNSQGGRLNIVELQQILNVDLSHIDSRVSEISKHDSHLNVLHGEIITELYISRIIAEINDLLQASGYVSVTDLSRHFNLPLDFLLEAIQSRLNTEISGHIEHSDVVVLYTDAYMARFRARVRGIANAITRPTYIGEIISRENLQDKMFISILNNLIATNELKGCVRGRGSKATYTPACYAEMQNHWVDSFYKANGYLDFDALGRLGVENPRDYAKKRFGSDVLVLSGCIVGPSFISQVEAGLDEVIVNQQWMDILPLLPPPCSSEDGALALSKTCKDKLDLVVFGTMVVAKGFIRKCLDMFLPLMKEKAEKDLVSNQKFLLALASSTATEGVSSGGDDYVGGRGSKKEERRKKATGHLATSKNQGTQGREKKTQKLKDKSKHHRHGHEEEEEDIPVISKAIHFMSESEITTVLKESYSDLPKELLEALGPELYNPLRLSYQKEAIAVLEGMKSGSMKGSRTKKKQSYTAFQESLQEMWSHAVLFANSIPLFEGYPKEHFSYQTWDSTEAHLVKHLLKTLCTQLLDSVVLFVAHDLLVEEESEQGGHPAITSEKRVSLIKELPEPLKGNLTDLNHTLLGKSMEDFFGKFDVVLSLDAVGVKLKKPDKKKERQLIFTQCYSLADQLNNETNPAMVLHLAVTLVFMKLSNHLLHSPGRVVPQIIAYLEDKHNRDISKEDVSLFKSYQELLVNQMRKNKDKEHSGKDEATGGLEKEGEEEDVNADNRESDQQTDEQKLLDGMVEIKQAALKYMSKSGRVGAQSKSTSGN